MLRVEGVQRRLLVGWSCEDIAEASARMETTSIQCQRIIGYNLGLAKAVVSLYHCCADSEHSWAAWRKLGHESLMCSTDAGIVVECLAAITGSEEKSVALEAELGKS